MRWLKRILLALLLLAVLSLGGGYLWMRNGIAPTAKAPAKLMRFDRTTGLVVALDRLKSEGIVENPRAIRIYAWLARKPSFVREGTYSLAGGMSADEVFSALQKPIRQMVRIPETNFSMRTAKLLELPKYQVATENEYLDLSRSPSEFAASVKMKLPAAGTLEGYLYPDTYDLPPLLGARGVIERQLKAFEQKAWPLLKDHKDPYKILKIASLIELEVAKDSERPIVAGVIYNRIQKNMSLGIDAALNYALGEWRPLTKKDLQIDSPYNLRRFPGLPPTPICSPTVKSIKAALNPAKHDYLFYVVSGKPDKSHRFAKTNAEHERNKRLWKQTLKEVTP
ncbi:MAG: endolytic transglycosylase MltG [Fimbriimonadaceae bacterium]